MGGDSWGVFVGVSRRPPPPPPPHAPMQVHLSRSLSLHTEQKANHDEVKSLAMSVANTSLLRIHSFFFKNIFYKNLEAEICEI